MRTQYRNVRCRAAACDGGVNANHGPDGHAGGVAFDAATHGQRLDDLKSSTAGRCRAARPRVGFDGANRGTGVENLDTQHFTFECQSQRDRLGPVYHRVRDELTDDQLGVVAELGKDERVE